MEILDNTFDYTELAVTLAIQELSSRNISEDEVKNYKDQQVEKLNTFISRNITDDLNLLQKILFFFIWFPLFNFAFKMNFKDDGYVLKLRQANYYSLSGFVSMFATAFMSMHLSGLATAALWILFFIPAYLFDEYFNRQRQIQRLESLFAPRQEIALTVDEEQDDIKH